jgi:hypothetical protein
LTADPKARRRVPVSDRGWSGSEDQPTQSSVEPGLPPELALGRDRSPNRAVWTTQEPDTRASRSGETALRGAEAFGSEVSVHGVAEAVPWSQAPGGRSGRSCCEHLRNLGDPSQARPTEVGRGNVVELTVHRSGWPSRRCRSGIAEAMFERLPIAACRSRLTFGGVDLSGLRRDRAPRLPACPGSRRKRADRRGH